MLLLLIVTPAYGYLHTAEENDRPFDATPSNNASSLPAVEHAEEYFGCSAYLRTGSIQTDHDASIEAGLSAKILFLQSN